MNFDSTKKKLVKADATKINKLHRELQHAAANDRLARMANDKALRALSKTANVEHKLALKDANSALKHAFLCGEALSQAKDKLNQHGKWLPWLEKNFEGSEDTAQVYMRLAKTERRSLFEATSIREALRCLDEPKTIVTELVEEPTRNVRQLAPESTDAQPVVASVKPKPTTMARYSAYRYLGAACEAAKEQGISGEELIDALKGMLSQYDLIQTTTHND